MKVTLLATAAILAGLSSPAFAVSYDSAYWDQTKVIDDLGSSSAFKADYYPLAPSSFGNQTNDGSGDFQVIAMADGIDDYKTAYVYLYHPSGQPVKYYSDFAKKTQQSPKGYRFNLSMTPSVENGYKLYSASMVNYSEDLRFVKMKLTGDFSFQKTQKKRVYDFADFDIENAEGSASNSYAQGKRFTFSEDSAGSVGLETSDIQTVKVNGFAENYHLPGNDDRTTDSRGYMPYALIPMVSSIGSVILHNYIFSLEKSFGDVIGVKLDYTLMPFHADAGLFSLSRMESTADADKEETSELYYYDSDLREIQGWGSGNSIGEQWARAGIVNNLIKWLYGSVESSSFPAVEKLTNPTADGWLKNGGGLPLKDNNPHYLGDKGNEAALGYYDEKPLSNVYVVHFDISDYIAMSNVFRGYYTWWEAYEVKPIELKCRKDGKVYILGVRADAVKAVYSTTSTSAPDWGKIWKLILTMLAGVVIVVLGCAVVDWALSSPKGDSGNA